MSSEEQPAPARDVWAAPDAPATPPAPAELPPAVRDLIGVAAPGWHERMLRFARAKQGPGALSLPDDARREPADDAASAKSRSIPWKTIVGLGAGVAVFTLRSLGVEVPFVAARDHDRAGQAPASATPGPTPPSSSQAGPSAPAPAPAPGTTSGPTANPPTPSASPSCLPIPGGPCVALDDESKRAYDLVDRGLREQTTISAVLCGIADNGTPVRLLFRLVVHKDKGTKKVTISTTIDWTSRKPMPPKFNLSKVHGCAAGE